MLGIIKIKNWLFELQLENSISSKGIRLKLYNTIGIFSIEIYKLPSENPELKNDNQQTSCLNTSILFMFSRKNLFY